MNKYYSTYVNDSKIISYKKPIRHSDSKGNVIRGVYDIETNNEEGKFIVGGLALNNGSESEDTRENYNIVFVNKPYMILQEIYQHSKQLGGINRYEIAIHNLIFDIQSLIYNILERGNIKYKEPKGYNIQDYNTYSIIMNERKQIYSLTLNYCGVNILFWDTLKLYPAPLSKLCETYQLKNYKLEAGKETYNSESFKDFVSNKVNVDYLVNDLLSVAELIDRNYYKKKTASSNAWYDMQKEICSNLGLQKRGDNIIKTVIEFWGNNKLNDYCLPGYNGGFCYANPKYAGQIKTNVIHLDINSSYPNAMYNISFPLTHKTSNKIECDRFICYCKGNFKLKDGKFPIIKHPLFMNNYLDHYRGDMLITDIEYERIFKNYDVTNFKIIEVMNFPKCEKVLQSFVEKNYAMKQNSTGFLREKAKLNLNSAYGKLAEHHNGQLYEAYINEDESILRFRLSDNTINLIDTEKSRCVIWAMFITAFAREKLYRCMDVLNDFEDDHTDHFLYTDTDSIFTDLDDVELKRRFDSIGEEIDPKKLGAWSIEGFSPYFKAIRAKCYLKTDKLIGKEDRVYRLNYVVAGYNGKDIVNGYVNEDISKIPENELLNIFNNFKIGKKVYDKETSIQCDYGIKQVKILTEFEIKNRQDQYEYIKSLKVV